MIVDAINRSLGVVLMASGRTWPVAVWLDSDGDECVEQNAAFAIVGPVWEGDREFWVSLDLSEFEGVATQ